jgi:ornithine cyclodeaminase
VTSLASHPPTILTASETRRLLPIPDLIESVGRAFAAKPAAPQRLVVADRNQDWVVMPGLGAHGGMLCKLLRVGHGESGPARPTISGVVVLIDDDGRVVSVLDGGALTARRTAAVAAYATDLLARDDASVLALFGAGALAGDQVEAIAQVRPLSDIRVVGRSPGRLRSFCEQMGERGFDVRASDARSAVRGADIVVTVTTSSTPVFDDADLAAGAHINAMGSYRPVRAEIPAATVARSRVVVETREGAWHEAGDLIQARDAGLIGEGHVYAELHERDRVGALREREPGAVTLFKSVGHVALDVAAVETWQAQVEAAATS